MSNRSWRLHISGDDTSALVGKRFHATSRGCCQLITAEKAEEDPFSNVQILQGAKDWISAALSCWYSEDRRNAQCWLHPSHITRGGLDHASSSSVRMLAPRPRRRVPPHSQQHSMATQAPWSCTMRLTKRRSLSGEVVKETARSFCRGVTGDWAIVSPCAAPRLTPASESGVANAVHGDAKASGRSRGHGRGMGEEQ